jgi:hypothetical protein
MILNFKKKFPGSVTDEIVVKPGRFAHWLIAENHHPQSWLGRNFAMGTEVSPSKLNS